MRGHFSEDRIAIEIEVYGISPDVKRKITALVDTGFSGSLTLPFTEAFPLSLILTGEQSYVLADGTTSRHFVCVGTVVLDRKSTRLNSSHQIISYAVFCLKKKTITCL